MMTVVDSNIWIAFLDKDDSQNKQAELFFEKNTNEILLTEYVVLEVCTITQQHVSKRAADDFLIKARQNPHVHFHASGTLFFSEMIQYFLEHPHEHLSFIDISLLYLSQFHTVVTFDKQLASAIKKAGRR